MVEESGTLESQLEATKVSLNNSKSISISIVSCTIQFKRFG